MSAVPPRRQVRRRGRYGQASLDPKPAAAGFGRESSLQLVVPPWELAGSGPVEQGSGLMLGGRNQPFPPGGCCAADRRPRRIAVTPAETANSAAPAGPATHTGHG